MKSTIIMIIVSVVTGGSMATISAMKEKPGDQAYHKAIFAGGCFWCLQHPFEDIQGVVRVTVGYTGGETKNPTYEQVSSGATGHFEAVEVVYDPRKVEYDTLVQAFWRMIDPTDAGGQFADRGSQYKTAIFYLSDEQKKQAEAAKAALQQAGKFKNPISTKILPAGEFYPAETYHQKYSEKNPVRYQFYFNNSGRGAFLKTVWIDPKADKKDAPDPGEPEKYVKPTAEELKLKLTPLQFEVTQESGTEKPFANEYWDNKREGIYVDIVSGEPLFSSRDKYDSGTGWPSFTKPVSRENVIEKSDRKLFLVRTEVRSRHGNSHLGHVFTDGPAPTGLRYCMNSASLKFIPIEDLEKEGYSEYKKLFNK